MLFYVIEFYTNISKKKKLQALDMRIQNIDCEIN